MRERIRQYQEQVSQTAQPNRELQQKVDEFEVELQGRSPLQSPLSSLPALDRLRELNSPYRNQVSEVAQLNTELQMKNDELVRQRNRLLELQELQQESDRMDTIIGQFRQKEMEMAALMTLNTNLQMRYEELRRANDALRSTFNTPFSPLPAQNLQPAMMSVAQLDGKWQTNLDNLIASFETRKKHLLTQLQQTTPEPISAPTSFGATVSSGLPGTLQSQPNPILTVSGRALSSAKMPKVIQMITISPWKWSNVSYANLHGNLYLMYVQQMSIAEKKFESYINAKS